MRPKIDVTPKSMYECFDCVGRTGDPDARTCPDCGGELRHIGRARDV